MRRSRTVRSGSLWVLALLVLLAPVAVAGDGTRVAKGVPDDVFLFVNWMDNPERDYLDKYWEEVWVAFEESGVLGDIKNFFLEVLPPNEREKIEASMTKALDLVGGVDWKGMFEKDGTYAMTMGPMGPYHLLVLEVDPEKVEGIVAGLVKLLQEMAGLSEAVSYSSTAQEGGATIHVLSLPGGIPYAITLGVLGDRIVLSSSRDLARRSLELLGADSSEGSILSLPKFREARGKLPRAEDEIVFFHMGRMMDGMRAMFRNIPQESGDEQAKAWLGMLDGILHDVDMMEYSVSVQYTEGYRNLEATYTKFRDDADTRPIWDVFGHQKPFREFQRFVPEKATSFSLSPGADVGALYRYLLGLFTRIPGSQEMLAKWDGLQRDVLGFKVYDDVLAKIGGETVSVSFPAANPTPFGSDSSVTMVRLKETQALADFVEGWLKKIVEIVNSKGIPVTLKPTEVVEGGRFHTMQSAMMPFVQPVIGFEGDYLVLATDADAVRSVLAVAGDPDGTILRNSRFTSVGLLPYSEVASIKYTNLEKQYRGMAEALGGIGMMMTMMGGMISAQMPPDAPNKEIMKIVTKLAEILPKLAPVVAKIDFYQDSVSFTYFDREGKASIGRSATTIRPPQ